MYRSELYIKVGRAGLIYLFFSDDRRRKVASDLLDYVCKHYDKAGFLIHAKLSLASEPN